MPEDRSSEEIETVIVPPGGIDLRAESSVRLARERKQAVDQFRREQEAIARERRRRATGGGGSRSQPEDSFNVSTPYGPATALPSGEIIYPPNVSTPEGPAFAPPPSRIVKAPQPAAAIQPTEFAQAAQPKRMEQASPEQIRAMERRKNPFFQFTRSFLTPSAPEILSPEAPAPVIAGGTLGAVALVAPAGKFGKGVKLGAKASKIAQAARRSAITKYLRDIGIGFGVGAASQEAAKKTGEVTATEQQKEFIKRKDFSEVKRAGFEAQSEAASKGGFTVPMTDISVSPRGIAEQVTLFAGPKEAFETGAREKLREQGFTGEELEIGVSAASRQRTAAGFGEITGLVAVSGFAEKIGRREVLTAFEKLGKEKVTVPAKKIGRKLFGKVAVPIGRAGTVEGAAGELTQELSREQDINLKNIGMMGAAGGVSAGLLGGGIAATKPNLPTVSTAAELGVNIIDPFEKAGDLLQEVSEQAGKRITGKQPRVPVITFVGKPEGMAAPSVSVSKPAPKPSVAVPPVSSVVPAAIITPTKPTAPVTIDTIIGEPTPKPTPTPTPTPVPVPPINIAVPTFAEEPTPTPTPTPTLVPVSVKIPTVTPMFRFPPPLPLQFPALGTGRAGRGKQRRKFANELQAGFRALEMSLGFSLRKVGQVPSRKSARRGKRR